MKTEWRSCFRIGVSAFLLYLCITYWPAFAGFAATVVGAALPLIIGCVIAYAINILMSFYEKHYFPNPGNRASPKAEGRSVWSRPLSRC